MIEVLLEKDYNVLKCAAEKFGLNTLPGSGGMLLKEGGEIIGAALFDENNDTAYIYAATAPDRYGPYFDLLLRATVNHLITRAKAITVNDTDDYYTPLGFTRKGEGMIAAAEKIRFPHKCNGGN